MWNQVELLLNEDTNTVRLYSDVEQESGNALYQVDTLVKLSSSEKVSKKLYLVVIARIKSTVVLPYFGTVVMTAWIWSNLPCITYNI